MIASVRIRWLFRSGLLALAIMLGTGATWLLGPAAGAAAMHPTAGTYEVYVQGYSPFSLVLEHDHSVGSGNSGSWAVQKHVVTIQLQGGPAGILICSHAGQPPNCDYSSTYVGPKTTGGIASSSAPGTATGYVGSYPVITQPFYAVRTGGVRSAVGGG